MKQVKITFLVTRIKYLVDQTQNAILLYCIFHLAIPKFYHSAWPILQKFVENADNLDAPGHFLDYLCRTENVAAFKLNASRLDIGSIDSDREANRFLGRKSLIILSAYSLRIHPFANR